jgi:hypothetical protein
MKNAIERAGDFGARGDVLFDELETVIPLEMRDVVRAPGDEVVEPDDRVAFAQKTIREV